MVNSNHLNIPLNHTFFIFFILLLLWLENTMFLLNQHKNEAKHIYLFFILILCQVLNFHLIQFISLKEKKTTQKSLFPVNMYLTYTNLGLLQFTILLFFHKIILRF